MTVAVVAVIAKAGIAILVFAVGMRLVGVDLIQYDTEQVRACVNQCAQSMAHCLVGC
jgi:hypothetical protein